jgi:hypothetical protein
VQQSEVTALVGSAPALRGGAWSHRSPQLALLTAVSLVLGCSFEDRPSLGRYDPPAAAATKPPAADDTNVAPVGAAAGSGGMLAPPPITTSADSGHASIPAPDAAALEPSPSGVAPSVDAGAIDEPVCAGLYSGSFTCTVDPPVTDPPGPTIPMTLTVQRSPGVRTANASANLSFSYAGFAFTGDVTGHLDCATNALHADIINGVFAAEVAPIPIPFSGAIDGELDQTTKRLAGSWSFAGAPGGSCTGTWSAKLQP